MSIQIFGKEYITVAERLQMVHQSGKAFEVVSSEPIQVGDRWLWRVSVKIDEKQYIGTAEAKIANARQGSPDSSNPFECAETSAMGRALGFAGFGAIESIASADEIVRGEPATTDLAIIKEAVKELGLVRNPQQWLTWKKTTLGKDIPDNKLAAAHIAKLQAAIEQVKQDQAA